MNSIEESSKHWFEHLLLRAGTVAGNFSRLEGAHTLALDQNTATPPTTDWIKYYLQVQDILVTEHALYQQTF